jgi:hypothetical protein
MAFIIKQVPDITVPVDIQVPGEAETCRIEARWKLHGFDAARARIEAIQAGKVTDEQLVAEDLLSAGPFRQADGTEIPFSAELAQSLLQMTYVRMPLVQSWFAAQNCRQEASAKN